MPSVKCRIGRIGDPVSCIAHVSPWGLVQRCLPRMPEGDGGTLAFEEEAVDDVGFHGQVALLLRPGICQPVVC